ncbi:MAG: hypothetical protein WCD70_06870 [Alphaproteobacteria bacterium]
MATIEQLTPIAEAFEAASLSFLSKEPTLAAEVSASLTSKEATSLILDGIAIMRSKDAAGITVENLTKYLQFREKADTYLERAIPVGDYTKYIPADKLTADDVSVLRGLGLPKLAQLVESILPAPTTPVAGRKPNAAPENSQK